MIEPLQIVAGPSLEELDALDREDRRPYAPAANVTAVIDRVRRINLPEIIDNDFLRVTGIPEGALGRVNESLRFLGLVNASGRPTDELRAIARSPDDESRDLLAARVRNAYATDFERVDPAQDPQARIEAQFRRYEPRSQTTRMVMLFLGLCRAAGMAVLDSPRERQMQGAARPSRSARATPARSTPRGPTAAPARQEQRRDEPTAGGLLMGVTVEDIAALSEQEFADVWAALGTIARARARPLQGGTPDARESESE